jgi:hypothetical protein
MTCLRGAEEYLRSVYAGGQMLEAWLISLQCWARSRSFSSSSA